MPQAQAYRWVVLAVATIAQASACFVVQGMGTLAPYIQSALHLRASEIGLLVSAAQLVPLVGLLLAGELLDRFGERVTVGVGVIMVAIALAAGSSASSYKSLLVWLVAIGVGYSTVQPGGSKLVAHWFSGSQRGLALGIRQAGLPIGGALAAFIFPIVVGTGNWQAAFLLGSAVALVGGTLFILIYRSPGAVRKQTDVQKTPMLMARLELLQNSAMRKIVWSGMTLMGNQYGILVFFTLYLRDRFGAPAALGARLLLIVLVAGAIGRVILAAWSDRCRAGRYVPVATCMCATAAGLLALVLLPSASMLSISLIAVCLGFFGFGWFGPWIAYVAEFAPPQRAGFGISLAMTFNQVTVIVCPPALGTLKDFAGNYTALWLALVAALTIAAVMTTIPNSAAVCLTEITGKPGDPLH